MCSSRNESAPCGALSRLPCAGNPPPDSWINSSINVIGGLSMAVFPEGLPGESSRSSRPVDRMLDLHKRLPKAEGAAKTSIERQIAATDKAIDGLAYELNGANRR